jgi:hypothetical protein
MSGVARCVYARDPEDDGILSTRLYRLSVPISSSIMPDREYSAWCKVEISCASAVLVASDDV